MAEEILEEKKIKLVVFVSEKNREQLLPLSENTPPTLFHVAGKKIIDWIYKITKKYGVEEIGIIATKNDTVRFREALSDYMLLSEPPNKIGPFHFFELNSKNGLSREISASLLEGFLSKESLWIEGNVIFSKKFFEDFLRKTQGTDKLALVQENEEEDDKDKEFMGIAYFAKRYLKSNLLGATCVADIYQRVSTKIASFFNTMPYEIEKTEFWKINYLWNLLDANQVLITTIKEKNHGTIEDNVTIIGKVSIEKGTRIRSGSYLEGPLAVGKNCDIGPNCYLRKGVSLDKNIRIGNACELKNTIVYDGTHIGHLSYVGDSIIGANCNFGAGTITGNLRLDDSAVKAKVGEDVISTGRRKMGVIMGNNVKTAINTYFMPGVIVGNNSAIGTGVILKRNLESGKFVYVDQPTITQDWKIKAKEKKKDK